MLRTLSIENYALIDKLDLEFDSGLSIITGETGAGKSILLGALNLILGGRADSNALKNKEQNCIVEVVFSVGGYGMEQIFEENDIDFDNKVTIRRLIHTSGKSRAFINDVPVNLNVLKDFGDRLLDIHSQHQNLLLNSSSFQLSVVDALAKTESLLNKYLANYNAYKDTIRKITQRNESNAKAQADYEYIKFQYEQLEAAKLKADEQEYWEIEVKQLSNVEEIKSTYERLVQILNENEVSVVQALKESTYMLKKINSITSSSSELAQRLDSAYIEIKDIAEEVERINGSLQIDPEKLAFAENRLNTIYDLQQKHRVASISELLDIQLNLEKLLQQMDGYSEDVKKLEIDRDKYLAEIEKSSKEISELRKKSIPYIEKYITEMLKSLGMPNVVFQVAMETGNDYTSSGKDAVNFLFSANKNVSPQEISKVASGGEISRVMLSLKSLLVKNVKLPTIIFDEIDTGISGEVANMMGKIIKDLSVKTQTINITHLPQVAAKGNSHYVVYKENTATATFTRVRKLNENERVEEIAKMLSGSRITDAALENARHLISES